MMIKQGLFAKERKKLIQSNMQILIFEFEFLFFCQISISAIKRYLLIV